MMYDEVQFTVGAWFKPKQFKFIECAVVCGDPSSKGPSVLVCYARTHVGSTREQCTKAEENAKQRLAAAYCLARLGVDPYINGVEGDFGLSKHGRMLGTPVKFRGENRHPQRSRRRELHQRS